MTVNPDCQKFLPALLAWVLFLPACDGGQQEPVASSSTANVQTSLTPALQASFDRSCKTCHGVTGTGAPGIGDKNAWADRNEKGLGTLLDHTLNGFGQMPPMGLCMECTQDEFVAFISYMSGLECEPADE